MLINSSAFSDIFLGASTVSGDIAMLNMTANVDKYNLKPHFHRDVIPVTWRTQQMHSELEQFQRIMSDVELHTILELGTGEGGTAALWALLMDPADGHLIVVDNHHPANKMYTFLSMATKIVSIMGDTHTQDTIQLTEQMLGGRLVDLLFIDADHRLSGVEQDFMNYRKLVRDEGIIAFHDITTLVTTFWETMSLGYEHWTIQHVEDSNGIGAIKYNKRVPYEAKFQ